MVPVSGVQKRVEEFQPWRTLAVSQRTLGSLGNIQYFSNSTVIYLIYLVYYG